jgi:hypothetical protein
MGFIDDKNNIVQQINLSEVLGDLPGNKLISNIASVKSTSKNLIPYLLDLLSIACRDGGSGNGCLPSVKKGNSINKSRLKCELIRILIEILVEFFPIFIRIIKEGIIKGIKAGLLCPASFKIPTPAPTVSLKPNEFDSNKLTTLDPTQFPASLFFGEPENDLNIFLADLMQSGVGSTGVWKNILDFEVISYPLSTSSNTNGLKVTINSSYIGKEYDVFLKDYINSIELFNFKNFVPNLMEELNGSITALLAETEGSLSLNIEKSIEKEKVNSMIEKILDTDPCEETFNLDDSFFTFDSDTLLDIEKRAENRVLGKKLINYSCTPTMVGSDSLESFRDVGELIKNEPSQAKLITKKATEKLLFDLSGEVDGAVGPQGDTNEDVKRSLSFDLALALPKLSTNIIFTPKIMVLFQVSKKLVTNTIDDFKDNFDFAIANRVFFEFVVRESGAALLEILYNQLKEEILKIVACITVTLIKEGIDKKLKQLKSLTGGFDVSSGISALKSIGS